LSVAVAGCEDHGERPALFGIAQGGLFPDLRRRAIEEAAALDLPGYALGGYAVGEEPEEMWEGVSRHAPELPADRPRYLMGVGTPEDLLAVVRTRTKEKFLASNLQAFDLGAAAAREPRNWLRR